MLYSYLLFEAGKVEKTIIIDKENDDAHVEGGINETCTHVVDLESDVCGGDYIDTAVAKDLLFGHEDTKIAIAYYFVQVLGCPNLIT